MKCKQCGSNEVYSRCWCDEHFCEAHFMPHVKAHAALPNEDEDTGAIDAEAAAEEAMYGIEMSI